MNEPLPSVQEDAPAPVGPSQPDRSQELAIISRGIRQTMLNQANAWLDISESLIDAELIGLPPDVVSALGHVKEHLSHASRYGLSAAVKLIRKEG